SNRGREGHGYGAVEAEAQAGRGALSGDNHGGTGMTPITRTPQGIIDWSRWIDRLEEDGLTTSEAVNRAMLEWTKSDMDPNTTGPESRLVTELSKKVGG